MVIGMVICAGVGFATLLTLYIVPVAYVALAKKTGSPKDIEKQLATLSEQARQPLEK
jgi:multidrug efflux pump